MRARTVFAAAGSLALAGQLSAACASNSKKEHEEGTTRAAAPVHARPLTNTAAAASQPQPAAKTVAPARGPMILVEGLDLAGKTTLAARLRDRLRAEGLDVSFSRNALCPANPIAGVADEYRKKDGITYVETGGLFLAAHIWDAAHFKAPAPGGRALHLQESSWLRTISFNTVKSVPMIPDLLRQVAPEQPTFDLVLFLTADVKVRAGRLQQREAEHPGENDALDALCVRNPRLFLQLEEALQAEARRYNPASTFVVIDSTHLTKDEVLDRAMEKVERLLAEHREEVAAAAAAAEATAEPQPEAPLAPVRLQ